MKSYIGVKTDRKMTWSAWNVILLRQARDLIRVS
jgi:hypothetical protein